MQPHEVIIGKTTFIVNSFSRAGATERLDQLLKRVIVSNAEKEFKNGYIIGRDESNYYRQSA
ncbi:MAG: transposon-encoded TnpW family protein [Firmicutes bacterium]|nr:transposon-encoded TnpW family protein [Bacillota bacterium]